MADVVVVAANVVPTASTITRKGIAAVAITAGDAIYLDASGDVDLCEKDQTAAIAACRGIALNDAAAGQYVEYAISGEVNMGAILSAGQVYIVGAAPGAIAPEADAVATNFVTVVGVGVSSTNLKLGILQSGVAHA